LPSVPGRPKSGAFQPKSHTGGCPPIAYASKELPALARTVAGCHAEIL
jgi:hypothetical protein